MSSGPLRQKLRTRFGMICHQKGTPDSDMEGMAGFKFKSYHKSLRGNYGAALGFLIFEPMQSIEHQATFPLVTMQPSESNIDTMSRTRV